MMMDDLHRNLSSLNASCEEVVKDTFAEYYYDGDIENLKRAWVREPHFVPLVTLYGFVFICGIAGNGLVVFAIVGSKMCRNVTFSFMLSLALADLLFVLVCVPHDTVGMVIGHWDGGRIFCKIAGYTEMLSAVASILNLTAISLERYHVIVNPMQTRRRCTLGKTRRMLLVVWMAAVVLSCPAYLIRDVQVTKFYNNETTVTTSLCGDIVHSDDLLLYFAIYQLVVMFLLPSCMMAYCYTVVIHALWISRKKLLSLTTSGRPLMSTVNTTSPLLRSLTSSIHAPSPTLSSRHVRCAAKDNRIGALHGRKQVVKMLITVVIIFLLCWGPKLIFQLLKRLRLEVMYHKEAFHIQIAVICLTYVQSCANPVIYGLMCRNFRVCLTNTCSRCRRRLCADHDRSVFMSEFEIESKMELESKPSSLETVAL